MLSLKTNRTREIRIAAATVAALVICPAIAAPTFAAPTPAAAATGGSGVAVVSPYAQPLEALGGMTLAQYVGEHQAGDARTHAGV